MYFLNNSLESWNHSSVYGIQNGCCAWSHENNINLIVHLHQSSWMIRALLMNSNILKGIFFWAVGLNVCVLVTQLCPTVCDHMDCSPPESSVRGILQVRILEWVTTSFSNVNFSSSSLAAKLCPNLATPQTAACQAPLSMGFSRQEHWHGLPFPSLVGLNKGLKHSASHTIIQVLFLHLQNTGREDLT